jgi:hypothetical protein
VVAQAVAAATHHAGATAEVLRAPPTPSAVATSSATPSGSGSRPGRAAVAAVLLGERAGGGPDAGRGTAAADDDGAWIAVAPTGGRVACARVARVARMARMGWVTRP